MDIHIKSIREGDCACDALILPLTEGDAQGYKGLPASVSKLIKKAASKEFSGKKNEVLLLPAPEDIRPERILLVGLGKKAEVSREVIRQAGGKAASYLRDMGMKNAALSVRVLSSLKQSPADFVEGALLGTYVFSRYKKGNDKKRLERLTVLDKPSKELRSALAWAGTVASAVSFARDMVNTPSNDMTPSHIAKAALALRRKDLLVKVLDAKDAKKLGMGAYLAVAKGSHEPLRFIVLEYRGAKGAPLVLIGKTITFDSGGISLKPPDGMEKMKYDMAGGAAVLGVMKAVSEASLPLHVIGILPATENLPGGSATKPGDVVRAFNGMTVEVINTDAEGRLILADAIGYAQRFKPRGIIDIATLTGACAVTFGSEAIAMMGNDTELLGMLKKASDATYERVWEMPLFEEYRDYVKSDIADIKNTGGKTGSLMTSAWFLKEFAGNMPWVHLDIAGTAWTDKEKPYCPKGASGVGVRLFLSMIKEMK